MYSSNLLAAAVVGAFLAACASGASLDEGPRGATDNQTQVRVTNDNWQDIRVYAERDGLLVRLGNVTTMATEVFRLPATFAESTGSIRLIADPIGSGDRHVTQHIAVWPGQLIDYTVRNHLSISSLMVRSR
jgi:hypothetical protein